MADAAPPFETRLPTVMWDGRLWAWDRNAANVGYPSFSGDEVTLTPNLNDRAGVIFLVEPITPPFIVTLEYLTSDDDGCQLEEDDQCRWSSADGWSFMFGKDIAAYESGSPPVGQARAFISDGTGVGIHFELYGDRVVALKDGALAELAFRRTETYFEEWRQVTIEVAVDGLEIRDGDESIAAFPAPSGGWPATHRWMGIGAGTGGAAAMHRIRRVRLE